MGGGEFCALSAPTYVALLLACPALQRLFLRVFFTKWRLQASTVGAPTVTTLSRILLDSLVRAGPTALHTLMVDEASGLHLGQQTSDVDVGKLVDRCPKLTRLRLSSATLISNVGLAQLARLTSMSHLYLYGSTGFGAGPSLLSSCVDLLCINLHGCTGITDDWLCSLAAACEQLWYVNVRGCTLLTDVSLTALRRLSCMRYLDLGGVTKLTTPALMLLPQCEALEILVLRQLTCGV
jgi:hypothetical protein